jgi:hypothetical protein
MHRQTTLQWGMSKVLHISNFTRGIVIIEVSWGCKKNKSKTFFYTFSGESWSQIIFLSKLGSINLNSSNFLGRFLSKSKKYIFLFTLCISIVVVFGVSKYRDTILSKHSPFPFPSFSVHLRYAARDQCRNRIFLANTTWLSDSCNQFHRYPILI